MTFFFFFKQTKCFFATELITVLKAGFLASSWKTHILLFGQNPSKILLAYKSQYQDTSSLPKWDEFPGIINIAGEEENLWLMLRWGLSLSPAHFYEMRCGGISQSLCGGRVTVQILPLLSSASLTPNRCWIPYRFPIPESVFWGIWLISSTSWLFIAFCNWDYFGELLRLYFILTKFAMALAGAG